MVRVRLLAGAPIYSPILIKVPFSLALSKKKNTNQVYQKSII